MNFAESLALKAVSLLLALILWVTILSLKPEERKVSIVLEPRFPPGMQPIGQIPRDVQFTLQGSRILLQDFTRRLEPIRADLSRSQETTFEYQTKELLPELPKGIKLVSYNPPSVMIRLEEIVEKLVPVKSNLVGVPQDGQEIAQIKITPAKVKVSAAKSLLAALEFVDTKDVDVTDLKGTKEEDVDVKIDAPYILTGEKVVKVKVTTRRAPNK